MMRRFRRIEKGRRESGQRWNKVEKRIVRYRIRRQAEEEEEEGGLRNEGNTKT